MRDGSESDGSEHDSIGYNNTHDEVGESERSGVATYKAGEVVADTEGDCCDAEDVEPFGGEAGVPEGLFRASSSDGGIRPMAETRYG